MTYLVSSKLCFKIVNLSRYTEIRFQVIKFGKNSEILKKLDKKVNFATQHIFRL